MERRADTLRQGSVVHKVWEFPFGGQHEVCYANNGAPGVAGNLGVGNDWNPPVRLSDSPEDSVWPALAFDPEGSILVAAWLEAVGPGGGELRASVSFDLGATWSPLGDMGFPTALARIAVEVAGGRVLVTSGGQGGNVGLCRPPGAPWFDHYCDDDLDGFLNGVERGGVLAWSQDFGCAQNQPKANEDLGGWSVRTIDGDGTAGNGGAFAVECGALKDGGRLVCNLQGQCQVVFTTHVDTLHFTSHGVGDGAYGDAPRMDRLFDVDYAVDLDLLLPTDDNHWFDVWSNREIHTVIDYGTDLKCREAGGANILVLTLSKNVWYHLQFVTNHAAGTYDVYVERALLKTCQFSGAAGYPGHKSFRLGDDSDECVSGLPGWGCAPGPIHDHGEAYWDNLEVRPKTGVNKPTLLLEIDWMAGHVVDDWDLVLRGGADPFDGVVKNGVVDAFDDSDHPGAGSFPVGGPVGAQGHDANTELFWAFDDQIALNDFVGASANTYSTVDLLGTGCDHAGEKSAGCQGQQGTKPEPDGDGDHPEKLAVLGRYDDQGKAVHVIVAHYRETAQSSTFGEVVRCHRVNNQCDQGTLAETGVLLYDQRVLDLSTNAVGGQQILFGAARGPTRYEARVKLLSHEIGHALGASHEADPPWTCSSSQGGCPPEPDCPGTSQVDCDIDNDTIADDWLNQWNLMAQDGYSAGIDPTGLCFDPIAPDVHAHDATGFPIADWDCQSYGRDRPPGAGGNLKVDYGAVKGLFNPRFSLESIAQLNLQNKLGVDVAWIDLSRYV